MFAIAVGLCLLAGGVAAAEGDVVGRSTGGHADTLSISGNMAPSLSAEATHHHCPAGGSHCLRLLSAAVLPQSVTDRFAVALTMAATMCAIGAFGAGVGAGRAPPRVPALLIWGRALLTRLCLLRR